MGYLRAVGQEGCVKSGKFGYRCFSGRTLANVQGLGLRAHVRVVVRSVERGRLGANGWDRPTFSAVKGQKCPATRKGSVKDVVCGRCRQDAVRFCE